MRSSLLSHLLVVLLVLVAFGSGMNSLSGRGGPHGLFLSPQRKSIISSRPGTQGIEPRKFRIKSEGSSVVNDNGAAAAGAAGGAGGAGGRVGWGDLRGQV